MRGQFLGLTQRLREAGSHRIGLGQKRSDIVSLVDAYSVSHEKKPLQGCLRRLLSMEPDQSLASPRAREPKRMILRRRLPSLRTMRWVTS
jgi:hypothetical protein